MSDKNAKPHGPTSEGSAVPQYEIEGRAMRANMEKLRALRLAKEAAVVAKRKADLERKVALLSPSKVDPDLADELVRENLGLVREDEFVIRLDK